MKTIIFIFLGLSSFVFNAIAQEQPFKNFRVIEGRYSDRWIIPNDFEQAFELLKKECIENNFAMMEDTTLVTAGLDKWLDIRSIVCVDSAHNHYNIACMMHGNALFDSLVFPKTTNSFLIPETLMEHLKEYAEENFQEKVGGRRHVFNAYVLVNKNGQPLTTYVAVSERILRILTESDLQILHDRIMKHQFDLKDVRFGYYTIEQMQEFSDMINSDTWRSMEGNDRLRWAEAWQDRLTPSAYGIIDVFFIYMEHF